MSDNESSDDEGPQPAKVPRVSKSKDREKRLIVILENASLETVKVEHYACWFINSIVVPIVVGLIAPRSYNAIFLKHR